MCTVLGQGELVGWGVVSARGATVGLGVGRGVVVTSVIWVVEVVAPRESLQIWRAM
jgi:hypothetical protein